MNQMKHMQCVTHRKYPRAGSDGEVIRVSASMKEKATMQEQQFRQLVWVGSHPQSLKRAGSMKVQVLASQKETKEAASRGWIVTLQGHL